MKKHLLLPMMLVFGLLPYGAACAENTDGLAIALRATLEHHPAISGKRAEVAAKSYAGDSARSLRLPTLSSQAAAQDINTNTGTSTRANTLNLRARQPLWAFGRIDSTIAFADADSMAEEADLLRVKRQFMDLTAVAYARVMGSRQRLRVAVEYIDSLEKLYQQVHRREQGQLASSADVRLALARLVQGRAQKDRIENELTVAESELLALTQIPVKVDLAPPPGLTLLHDASKLEALAQERSADVGLKIQRAAVARADVEREKDAPKPTLYLQADRSYSKPTYGNESTVGVVLEASLDGLGFAASGRSNAAEARRQAVDEDLNATRSEISRVVKSLYANRQLQQNLVASQNQGVAELIEIMASYRRQYEAGYKTWIEVLNIQRELAEQQLLLAQAENDWLVYTLKLAVLTGELDALIDMRKEQP